MTYKSKDCDPDKRQRKVAQRAGTFLDHKALQEMRVADDRYPGKMILIGHIDPTHNLYQWGGDINHLVYWERRVATIHWEVWQKILQSNVVSRLEMVDNCSNTVYMMTLEKALQVGYSCVVPMGHKFCIPYDLLDRFDVDGRELAKEPRPEPKGPKGSRKKSAGSSSQTPPAQGVLPL